MADEPIWPLASELIDINQVLVEVTGEPHTLLKANELESACKRPYNKWYYDEEDRIGYLAAALIVGVARNHPFEQGNKRTAFAAGVIFLENNGYILEHPDTDDFGPLVEAAVIGDLSEEALAEELEPYLVGTL